MFEDEHVKYKHTQWTMNSNRSSRYVIKRHNIKKPSCTMNNAADLCPEKTGFNRVISVWCLGEVIKAWDIAVGTMKIGELCRITCKSEYAYGAAGSPPKIPPNATLIFEVSCRWVPAFCRENPKPPWQSCLRKLNEMPGSKTPKVEIGDHKTVGMREALHLFLHWVSTYMNYAKCSYIC